MTHDLDLVSPANRLPLAKAVDAAHRPAATTPRDRSGPEDAGAAISTEVGSERPRLELTATQLAIGAAAAVTTAVLGSTLGVAGTVVGAGVGSAVSITASAVYTHSLAATRHRWQQARSGAGASPAGPVNDSASLATPAHGGTPPARPAQRRAIPEPRTRAARTINDRTVEAAPASDTRPAADRPRTSGPFRWSSVLAGALGTAVAFAAALLLITGIESITGHPLAGGTQGGLSVLGGGSGDRPDPTYPVTTTGDEQAPVTSTVTDTTVTHSTVTQPTTVVSTVTTTPSATPTGSTDRGAGASGPDSGAPATGATGGADPAGTAPTAGTSSGDGQQTTGTADPAEPGDSTGSTDGTDPVAAGAGSASSGTDGDASSSGTADSGGTEAGSAGGSGSGSADAGGASAAGQ